MEEQKINETQKSFTEKEVMDIISNMQNDYNKKLAQSNNVLTRLSFLFKVLDHNEVFKDNNQSEFITSCVNEIVDIISITEEHTDETR